MLGSRRERGRGRKEIAWIGETVFKICKRWYRRLKMYYQEGLTQETIAKKLRTSRPAVPCLLAEARKTGVVQIKIKDPEVNNEELAGQFQKRFGLKKCLVIPCGIRQEDVVLKIVASQAARFASRMMKSHTTVGTSWGGSCYEFMQAFPRGYGAVQYHCGAFGGRLSPADPGIPADRKRQGVFRKASGHAGGALFSWLCGYHRG